MTMELRGECDDLTGGDYEDVLWAYKKWETSKI